MKKIYNVWFVFALISIIHVSCSNEDSVNIGVRGKGVAAKFTGIESAFFVEDDKENTFVKFTIDVPENSGVTEAKLQVSYNGGKQRIDYGQYESFPATVILPLVDVASLLDMSLEDIKGGDVINVEVLVEASGDYYRSNTGINPLVACAYDPANISGSYSVVSASWESSGSVTFTVDPNDPYTFYVVGLAAMDGFNEDGGPLPFVVNPLDYSVTASKTVLASIAGNYSNYSYEGNSPGTLNTCDGTYRMSFEITVDQGSFGTYSDFIFTKK